MAVAQTTGMRYVLTVIAALVHRLRLTVVFVAG
jgi:hypothetical protein